MKTIEPMTVFLFVDIVMKLKLGEKGETRPPLNSIEDTDDELIKIMENCWAEEPVNRPDFRTLKSQMRNLTK